MRKLICLLFGLMLPVADARAADRVFSGEDGLLIDWTVKHCAFKSTDKEHALVDAAKAKGADAFEKQYLKHYQDKSLTDALASTTAKQAMCQQIKGWYGPAGTRFADLIVSESASATAVPTSTPTAAREEKAASSGRRRSR